MSLPAGNLSYRDVRYSRAMAAKRATTEDLQLVAYLGHLVRTERARLGKEDKPLPWDDLAKEIGMSKPQLKDLDDGLGGAGMKTLRVFADHFFKGKIDDLHAAAREYAEKQPLEIRTVVLDAVNPKEAVQQSGLYKMAQEKFPLAVRQFDRRDPYTPGDQTKDEEHYTRRLLHWIDAERNGDLNEFADATPVKPRKKRAR